MPDTITRCIEEEYSFCLSYLWRWRGGWRPLFIYFRGPRGVPFFIAPFLTLLGLWRFARRPRRLIDVDAAAFCGATVTRICSRLGSYGMGGLGFVGLKLRLANRGSVWVVFTVWGAAGWLMIGDELVAEGYSHESQRELVGDFRFRPLSELVGATLTGSRLEHDLAELTFSGAQGLLTLRLRRDSSALPVHGGSKQPKMLALSEDIRDAVVVSRRASLWVGD